MTARVVNGRQVVRDEPTPSPARPSTYLVDTRTLTLDNRVRVYGCGHCDYTSENVRSIGPHLRHCEARPNPDANRNGHHDEHEADARRVIANARSAAPVQTPAPAPAPEPPAIAEPDRLIEKVIGTLTEARTAARERDQWEHLAVESERETARWRSRAEKAEAALKKLFDALGVSP